MNWKLMFPSNYLAAVEFGTRVFSGRISEVKVVDLEDDKGATKARGVVFFEGQPKGLVLCKTNAICLAGMFGDDTSAWVGKHAALYSTPVQLGKEKVPGIRVKGSADIEKPIEVTVKLPRKKPFKVVMQPMGKGAAKPDPAPPEAPTPDDGDAPQD